jgi:hypothetical protein
LITAAYGTFPAYSGGLHLQCVALAHQLHDEVEFGAGGFRAAGDIDVDVVAVDAVAQ